MRTPGVTSGVWTVPATASAVHDLRYRLQDWLREIGADELIVEDLGLAAYEAMANVAEHAYRPDHSNPLMRVSAEVGADQVLIAVTDHGAWRSVSDPGLRGRGLEMMRELSTELLLESGADGTCVQLSRSLETT